MTEVGPAAGQKYSRSNPKRNFGNVGRASVPAGIRSAQRPTLLYFNVVSYKRTEVHEFGIGPPASPERLAMAGRECGMRNEKNWGLIMLIKLIELIKLTELINSAV